MWCLNAHNHSNRGCKLVSLLFDEKSNQQTNDFTDLPFPCIPVTLLPSSVFDFCFQKTIIFAKYLGTPERSGSYQLRI